MRSKRLLYQLLKIILSICFLWGGNFVFAQECEWIEAPMQTYSQYNAVAVDENNDVISVGLFPQGFSIQNIVFPSPVGNGDGFVAKFTNGGIIKWVTQVIPSNSSSRANFYQVETDKQNNIYTIGYLEGSVSFGNGISATTNNAQYVTRVVVKYNSNGIAQWANIIEDSAGNFYKPRLAIGNNGDVFVGFTLRASIYFNGTNHSPQTLAGNFLFPSVGVVKYNTNGNFIFVKSFGGLASNNWFENITIDQHNNLYFLAASLYGATIGSKTHNNSGYIIIKTDSAINYINSRMIVTTQSHLFVLNSGVSISISAQDNGKFVLSGRFADTVDFGGVIVVCQNGSDGSTNGSATSVNDCIVYYDSSLNAVWARKETTQSKRVVTTSEGGVKIKNGFIFFGGVYRRGDTQFGDTFLPAIDSTSSLSINYSAFIVKMDSLGNFLWVFTPGRGVITDIAIDNNFNSFITGFYQDSIQLFNKKVVSSLFFGRFLAKIKDYRIVRGYVSEGPYCAGDSVEIPYTKYGRYDSTNQFIAQLSDSAGNFDGGQRELGRITSTEDGIVKGKLPLFNVATNNKYRIRIISTNPIVQSFYKKDTLQLLIYSKDTANAGVDFFVCRGQQVRLGTTGGSAWNWSPDSFMLNSADTSNRQPLIMPDSAIEYRIIISDSSGCGVTDTDYVKVFIRPDMKTSIQGDSIACRGLRQTLKAAITGGDSAHYWYIWKTVGFNIISSTTNSLTIRPVITTQYMVITGDSCSNKIDTTYFTVNVQNNLKAITTPDTSLCLGNTIILSVAGIGCNPNKYTYEWFEVGNSNAISNNDSITVSPATTSQYSVILKDTSTFLVDTAHIKITVYQPLQLTVNADSAICIGEKAELRATATGGNPNKYQILWTANNQQLSTNNTVQVTPTTTTTYKALLSDGCSLRNDSAEIKITVRPPLKITVNPDTTICIGESAELRATATGGLNTNHKLQWTANNQQLSTNNQLQVTPITTTTYWATLSDGCTTPNDSATITVSVRSPLKVSVNPDTTICTGETVILKAITTGGNTAAYQVQWTANNQQLSTNNTVQVTPTTTTTYKAVLKDNCTILNDSASITITIRPPLSVKGTAKDSICANQILLLTATPQGGYIPNHQILWSVDNGLWTSFQNPATDTPKITTKYIVQLSDNCSPTVYDTLKVIVLPVPKADFTFNPTQGCPPLMVDLQDNSTGNDTTLNIWSIGNTEYQNIANFAHQFTQTGTYSLKLSVVNALGCADQKVQPNVITVFPKPKADFIVKPDIKETEEPLTLLNRSSTNTVIWDMGDGNQLIPNPNNSGDTTYTYHDTGWLNLKLIAQNNLGCYDTATQQILIYDKVHCIIPSAFTPNGNDNINPVFAPVCVGVASYTLTIYNRWGQIIYLQENGAWDGTYSDTPVPDDVYMYKLQIQADSHKKKLTYGTVQVIK